MQEAKAELARIETEARTLAKILNAASGDLFPAVLEQIKVERGYETALGAALGEDLDVPLDRSAPAHWGDGEPQPGDPRLPEGVVPLAERRARAAAAGAPAGADRHRRAGRRPRGCQDCWRPASGWSAATARCGAGTGWWPAPMRRPPPRSAWRRRTAWPSSTPKPSPRRAMLRAAEQALADAERALREGSRGRAAAPARAGATRSIGLDAARDALARRPRRRPANCRAGAPRSTKSRRALGEAHAEAAAAVAEAEQRPRSARPTSASCRRRSTAWRPRSQRDRAALADARARHDGLKREAEQRDAPPGGDRRRARQLDRRAPRMPTARSLRSTSGATRPRAERAGARRRARRDRRAAPRADVAAFRGRERCARPPPTGLQQAENQQAELRQGGDRGHPGACRGARDAGPRRGAADRRRRAAPRGRGAHPGGAEHAAASGHPPHRAGARQPAARHRRGRAPAGAAEDRARAARRRQSARRGRAAGAVGAAGDASSPSART